MDLNETEILLSLPSASVASFSGSIARPQLNLFAASDPEGVQLSSGGGTAHLLNAAFRSGSADSWSNWLSASRKLLIHGSGESRRLPSYAACGKPLTPLPVLPGFSGQRPDQMLFDLQAQTYSRLFWHAPKAYRVMITCGDVLVQNDTWVPTYPEVDVLIVGLPASMAEARHHGVLVCREDDGRLDGFLQKPSEQTLRELPDNQTFYLDTGIWLLSERALEVLMAKCGWDSDAERFSGSLPEPYDLYAEFGPGLGAAPAKPDPDVSGLTCAALPLNRGHFYHFGTSRALIESVHQLSRPGRRTFGDEQSSRNQHITTLHSSADCSLTEENQLIWIENASIPSSWQLHRRHVLTGIPPNDWTLSVPDGVCIDAVAIDDSDFCLRTYGFDDPMRGSLESADTLWMGTPVAEWFRRRGISPDQAGIDVTADIHVAPLYPQGKTADWSSGFIQWLIDDAPEPNAEHQSFWLSTRRLSARDLLSAADVATMHAGRKQQLAHAFSTPQEWAQACCTLDLQTLAGLDAEGIVKVPPEMPDPGTQHGYELARVHDGMYRIHTGATASKKGHTAPFSYLRDTLIEQARMDPVAPCRDVLDDQIIWARSPIRLDLAGGWTDTPPYCLEHGGRVVNVALDLNGQPPIQVFARVCSEPHVAIHSIDLGLNETVNSFEALTDFGPLGGGFGIARAALCLAGFDPRFHEGPGHASLPEMLKKTMGGGIEISLLAAAPKGSGLGTSSILAATVLGALSELCHLNWDRNDLFTRTLVLEQLLTSGGGWQDQVGGIVGGLKCIETSVGLHQQPVVRGLPREFFVSPFINRRLLLYYTGLTRVAHDILEDIVTGIFLNSNHHLGVVHEIGTNAGFCADAIQRRDYGDFCEAIQRSWQLNQRLDSGTNPPAVQAILDSVSDYTAAAKLLGAGGGGYLLILARDEEAGMRIRESLQANPPNAGARFVNMNFSETGYQVTRS